MQEALNQKIDAFIAANKEQLLKDIAALVSINSVEGTPEEGAPYGAGPRAALDKTLELAAGMGLATRNCEGHIGYAELAGADAEKYLATICHVDVVPEGNGWTQDPFQMEIRDGWMIGRGVADDKGPMVATLYALKFLKEEGVSLRYPIRALMGDNEETSGENFDRTDLNLPGRQLELVQAVYATGTPVVLVLQSGRPVTANWENDHLPAILEAWFPGEQGGTAIAKTLFGNAAPGGRLPITFPRSVGQIPCHYSRRPGGGKRYVEMDWLPLYPFGYGLTYTTFAYRDMALSRSVIDPQDTVTVSVTVTNTGKYTGDAVPQLYVRDMFSSVVKPERQLAAFRRLTLAPGESRRVELTVGPKQLRTLGSDYVWRVEPGKFELQLGDNAENILLRADLTVE